jgi:ABC-type phosphate transport system substrate-binding protein
MRKTPHILVSIFFALAPFAAWASVPTSVISNPSHKIHLSKDELKEIYLGLRKNIDDWRVVPLDQKDSSPIRDEFYKLIVGKDQVEMKIFRAEQIFSGKARSLPVFSDDQAVIQEVLNNPGAIGYVNASTDTSKVNVLLRIE